MRGFLDFQAVYWKIKTALQKKYIRWQGDRGWYGYPDWIRENEPGPQELVELRMHARHMPAQPLVSLLVAWDAPTVQGLRLLASDLNDQVYPNWEAILAVGPTVEPAAWETAAALSKDDSRIHLVEVPRKTRDLALAALDGASGEFVLLIEGGDRPAPTLLYEIARRLANESHLDILYFDEDQLAGPGQGRQAPFFKPGWSPELLLSVNYLVHAAFRREHLHAACLSAPQNASWEDLVLRCTEAADRIGHIPKVLYHGLQDPQAPAGAERRLAPLAAHLERLGLPGAGASLAENGQVRVSWPAGEGLISIIIPSRDRVEVLRACIESIQALTRCPPFELLVVDSASAQEETLRYYAGLRKSGGARIIEFPGEFNYSAANNLGARHARGDLFVFLNNDTQVIEADWLEELARWARRPEIGAAGALLLYPDSSIQHAGIIVGMEGHGSHVFSGSTLPGSTLPDAGELTSGPFGPPTWYRDVSAVTGACLAVRRQVFEQMGGFDEAYELVFSDIEFCLRLRERGFRIVYTPYARLVHHEGQTRRRHIPAGDIRLGYDHLKQVVAQGDPYYNPNLSTSVRTPTFRRRFEAHPIDRLEKIVRYQS
jgi:GT2 family glycosyltransferase